MMNARPCRMLTGSSLLILAALVFVGCGDSLVPPRLSTAPTTTVAASATTISTRTSVAPVTTPTTTTTVSRAPREIEAVIERFAGSTAAPSTPVAHAAVIALSPAPIAQIAPTLRAASVKPSGSQLLSRNFFSVALGRDMPYFVYLPVGYAESGKRYPVLYMLHGYGGSNTEWLSVGFPEEADREMNAGEIPQMVIVFPQGDQAYWVNHADGGDAWGDYTAHDVVTQIDATYRTLPDAPHRAIGGLSMGGHGAMQLALNYPNVFSVVGMHSPTLRDFADRFDYFGDEAYFDAHDPAHLVQKHPEQTRLLKIFVDIGEQDALWYDKTVAFHDLLTHGGIPHEFHTWPGDHNGEYWSAHNRDYLRFYGASLAPA